MARPLEEALLTLARTLYESAEYADQAHQMIQTAGRPESLREHRARAALISAMLTAEDAIRKARQARRSGAIG